METINEFMRGVEFIVPSREEISILEEIDSWYEPYVELSPSQRNFLNSLILRKKPKHVLELGVSDGGSSCVILNALEHIGCGELVSVDLANYAYKHPDRKTGWCVEHFPDFLRRREIYRGNLAYKFMDEVKQVGKTPFDFIFIDTIHMLPGEILDFLMVFPYIEKNAVVVFHDISLHHEKHFKNAVPTALLMSAIHGKKLLPEAFSSVFKSGEFPNIGAVQMNERCPGWMFDVFNLLTFRWNYRLEEDVEADLVAWFEKHYGQFYAEYFQAVCMKQRENYSGKIILKEIIKRFFPIK